MNKFLKVLSIMVLFTMIFTACAPKTKAEVVEEPTVAEEADTNAATTEKPLAGQEITFLTIQPHTVASQNLAQWFEEETGCKVTVDVVPYDNVVEKAVLDVTSGVGYYDVIDFWYPGLGTLVENGVLKNLDEWYAQNEAELELDDLIVTFKDVFTTIDGHKYAFPFDGDMHLLYYNTEIFEKYGQTFPTTWDEYYDTCKAITEAGAADGVYGCAIMGAKSPLILIGTYLNRLGSYGGAFFDAGGNPTINSPEAVAALEALVAQAEYALPTASAVAFDEALGGWFTGKAAMVEFWTDLPGMTDDPESSSIVGKWGVGPLPMGSGEKAKVVASVNAGFGIGVSAVAPHPNAAMEFLKFVARPDIAARYNTVVGGIDPVRYSTLEDPAYIEFAGEDIVNAIKTAHANAITWPTSAKWFELQEPLTDNLSLALIGEKTPQQALDDTQATWLQILGK
ncbi:MAG: sugar ABC transporter substrate-binding protein [Anaerolineaceae bacterium]|jgi:multiple sugar transport system substrate-binding protein|nr:MAG: sugar ABC transporter substrate-binding protein [Anaerolineaceae bacterium]